MSSIFKRKTLELDLYGEKFSIRYPSLKEMGDYEESVEGKSSKQIVTLAVDFLCSLGMNKETVENMDYDDFVDIMAMIRNPKKKQ